MKRKEQHLRASPDLEAVIGQGPMTKNEARDKLWGYLGKKHPAGGAQRYSIASDERLVRIFKGRTEVGEGDLDEIVSEHLF